MTHDDTQPSDDATAPPVTRRRALKVLSAAAVSVPVLDVMPLSAAPRATSASDEPAEQTQATALGGPRGTASDPDLLRPKKDWPRKLTVGELAVLTALCDVIIPADAKSPSASAVGAPAYINEHVSAPYDGNARDLVRVRGGVQWIQRESRKRFGKGFASLTGAQKTAICDDICYAAKAKPEFLAGARFFSLVRNLTATAFYTTDAGMKDIGYIGNVALPKWDAPPNAVLAHLKLDAP